VSGKERTNRHDAILLHAAELFATKGVSATTVRQIADRVGMLSGSLYHHFSSKDLIAEEIVINYLDDLRATYRALGEQPRDALDMLREVVKVSFDVAANHPHAVEIYQNETAFLATVPRAKHIETVAKEVHTFWAEVIDAGVASGQLRSDVSARLFHRLLRDAVWLSPRWYRPTKDYPHAQLAEDVLAVFLEGFATNGRKAPVQRAAATKRSKVPDSR
jgi:AcrR family transcriptional regulator